jgi:hypothetical protein
MSFWHACTFVFFSGALSVALSVMFRELTR